MAATRSCSADSASRAQSSGSSPCGLVNETPATTWFAIAAARSSSTRLICRRSSGRSCGALPPLVWTIDTLRSRYDSLGLLSRDREGPIPIPLSYDNFVGPTTIHVSVLLCTGTEQKEDTQE